MSWTLQSICWRCIIMYRVLISLICLLCLYSTSSYAQYRGYSRDEIMAKARVLDYKASAILGKTNIALSGLAAVIKRVDLTEEDAHLLFGEMVDQINGVRAIIYISKSGALTFDSFSFPVPKVNLSSRSYFTRAMAADESNLIIDKPVKGKTSGIPFIPIAKSVWKNGKPIGVLGAIVTPSSLVVTGDSNSCAHCVSLITDLAGNVISNYPEGVELSDKFKAKLKKTSKTAIGKEIITVGSLKARVHWIRNQEYPFISVFLEFIRG